MGFIGSLLGFFVVSALSDNQGRYKILLVSWGITVFGAVLLVASQNLWMVGASMLIITTGSNSCFNISFAYLSEVFDHKNIDKNIIIFQLMYPIVTMIMTTQFLFINNWILIVVISILTPAILVLGAIFFFAKETPEYLLRQGVTKTLEEMNKIGKMNFGIGDILSEKDVINVIKNEKKVNLS